MTKILNLDTLEQSEDKTVILRGVKHKFVPFSVEDFITQVKEIKEMEKGGEMGMDEYAEFMITAIKRAFPTIEVVELRKLTMDQLRALSDFVKSVAEDEAKPATETTDAQGNDNGAAN